MPISTETLQANAGKTLKVNSSGTEIEFIEVLPVTALSGLSKITVGATEPSTPAIGDLWISIT